MSLGNPPSAVSKKLSAFVALSGDELRALDGLQSAVRPIAPGEQIVIEGQANHQAFILNGGWACSFKVLRNGSRQVVDFQVPGDFLGLRSLLLRKSDHSFAAVTAIEVCEISKASLLEAFANSPRLATAVFWAVSRDEAMVVEHLVNIGRRSATERTAHFFLELGDRMALIGQGTRTAYACPLTQYHLSDALGLSAIHLNRILRQLREKKLMVFQKGVVTITNRKRLIELAQFDDEYMDENEPLLR